MILNSRKKHKCGNGLRKRGFVVNFECRDVIMHKTYLNYEMIISNGEGVEQRRRIDDNQQEVGNKGK